MINKPKKVVKYDKKINLYGQSKSKSPQISNQVKQSEIKKSISPTEKNRNQIKKLDNNNIGKKNSKLIQSSSKKSLKRSLSEKKLKKSFSKKKLLENLPKNRYHKNIIDQNHQNKLRRNSIDTIGVNKKIRAVQSSMHQIKQQKQLLRSPKQQKDIGLVLFHPPGQKIDLKGLQINDDVYQKYLQMVINDNDSNYVLNALPELHDLKKSQNQASKDFIKSNKISGMFNTLNLQKLIGFMRKIPNYYKGPSGRNLRASRLILITKFKVSVDLGFLQYSIDADKLTIFRIYISKIYRRMNYLGYVYLQVFKGLLQRHGGNDKWSIFIMQKNEGVHKFFKYLGFKIQRIASQSKDKSMNYFQEFYIPKKDLQRVISGTQIGQKAY